MGFYGLLVAYIVVVGFWSVVPQVFWPSYPAAAARAMPEDCATGVRMLRDELLDRAAGHAENGFIEGDASIDRWFESWDDRHHAMSPRCRGEKRGAWRDLARLRHRIDASLRRNHRDHAELAAALRRELDSESPR